MHIFILSDAIQDLVQLPVIHLIQQYMVLLLV